VIQLRLEAGRAQLRTQERDDVGHQAVPDEDDADRPRAGLVDDRSVQRIEQCPDGVRLGGLPVEERQSVLGVAVQGLGELRPAAVAQRLRLQEPRPMTLLPVRQQLLAL